MKLPGVGVVHTTAHYTGGCNGWGTLVYKCSICGEEVAEFECDEKGLPVNALFDFSANHICEVDDEE